MKERRTRPSNLGRVLLSMLMMNGSPYLNANYVFIMIE